MSFNILFINIQRKIMIKRKLSATYNSVGIYYFKKYYFDFALVQLTTLVSAIAVKLNTFYDILNSITENVKCETQTVVNFCLQKCQHKKN